MANRRGYQRTDRVNELLREIIAEQLTREDDDGLAFVTITSVDVDREFEKARVYYTTVDGDDESPDVVRRAIVDGQLKSMPAIHQALEWTTPDGCACGLCDSCLLRRKGFAEAGLVDPAVT